MICFTEPGLTWPCIYCIYIKLVTCKMERKKKTKKLDCGQSLPTVTDKRQIRPVVREGAQNRQDSKIQKELKSGSRSQSGRQETSPKRRHEGSPVPGGVTGHPVPRGYKYGNLALTIGEYSDERVKHGYGFCATRTIE
jgi:hypothetical protein